LAPSLCAIKIIEMGSLPFYIVIATMAVAFLTLYFLYKATDRSKKVVIISLAWLALQAIIGLSGFYEVTNTMPPRFALTLAPPLIAIAVCLFTKSGKQFLDSVNTKWLTILHVVRIPVEMMLLWLFLQKYVPQLMTFEGRNFDMLSGLTAPLIFYFGFIRKMTSRKILLAWNFICLALLFNIVINAILAAPFRFQQFAFDQPNIAVLYFPFVWLPAFIVPVVLFSHLASIRQLLKQKEQSVAYKNKHTSAAYITT
jgi:hypothetical protein